MSTIASDTYDFERSRAAVAIACLQWLRCTGPAVEPEPDPATKPEVADLSWFVSPILTLDLDDWPHPLWDRWLDGRETGPRC